MLLEADLKTGHYKKQQNLRANPRTQAEACATQTEPRYKGYRGTPIVHPRRITTTLEIALGRAGAFVPGTHGGWIAGKTTTTDQNELAQVMERVRTRPARVVASRLVRCEALEMTWQGMSGENQRQTIAKLRCIEGPAYRLQQLNRSEKKRQTQASADRKTW